MLEMNGKIIIGVSVGLIIGLLLGIFASITFNLDEIFSPSQEPDKQNPKIFCNAKEDHISSYYQIDPETNAIIGLVVSEDNVTEMPNVEIQILISNNNSIPLYNVGVEVSYLTIIQAAWNTTTKTDTGFIDAGGSKRTTITLVNPYLELWQTTRPVYLGGITVIENVTVCVLDLDNVRFTAYGYAEP